MTNIEELKPQFLNFLERRYCISYSQRAQDIFALFACSFKKNGYFVEFGALNGIDFSNTYLLEKIGWKGIACEPHPDYAGLLNNNRNCSISTRCVDEKSANEVPFVAVAGKPARSGIRTGENDEDGRTVWIETVTLEKLLQENDAPDELDFLSIDTEGTEYRILKAFDFTKYKFNTISVEHNFTDCREKIKKLLEDNNYTRVWTEISGHDDWYVHNDNLPSFEQYTDAAMVANELYFLPLQHEVQAVPRARMIAEIFREVGKLDAAIRVLEKALNTNEAKNPNLIGELAKTYKTAAAWEKLEYLARSNKELFAKHSELTLLHMYSLFFSDKWEQITEILDHNMQLANSFEPLTTIIKENGTTYRDRTRSSLKEFDLFTRQSVDYTTEAEKIASVSCIYKENESYIDISSFDLVDPNSAFSKTIKSAAAGRTLHIPEVCVSKLKSALCNGSGVVLTSDRKVFEDSNLRPHHCYRNGHRVEIVNPPNGEPENFIEGTTVQLTRTWPLHFQHWFHDCFSQLYFFKQALGSLDDVKVLLGYGNRGGNWVKKSSFQVEALEAIGIKLENIIVAKENDWYCFDTLLTCSLVNEFRPPFNSIWYHPGCFSILDDVAKELGASATNPNSKLYFSRKDSRNRSCLNESEIESLANENGFQSISLANRSLAEQLTVTKSANVIYGLAGNNLGTISWMPTGSTLIIIVPQEIEHVIAYYQIFCSMRGIKLVIMSTMVDRNNHASGLTENTFTVDANLLESTISD